MKNESALADLLGIAPYASGAIPQSEMVARINAGLPIGAVARVATAVAPDDRTFAFHLVKRATLHRRRSASTGDATLSALEGAKVVRVARVWEMACEVWKDDDAARDFLRRPHPLLEGRPPIDVVLESEFGGPRGRGRARAP
ncbi:antitoxin Xre-like helix-turn-helix domain-containing protein [Methylobacterium sp. WL8]|uniref:antitoxin Xre-like helix-turn-helix domain-containing protein n=1 Tax=Methylobacterium sp. WL8 TaxID=2603899 RepID=UPI0011C9996E|nr:antitoxin Xre-like helix-turn-helix domain-containing protein [Methylobacterium sp. WL8]TXN84783.1 DUF2384 domain-containing protein [Methylobacterium sp. WL8]